MSDGRKLLFWTFLGFTVCGLLIPLITDASGTQTYLNLASFILIYTIGVGLLTAITFWVYRLRAKPNSSWQAVALLPSKTMVVFMFGFGLFWYDFSGPRPHSFFSDYSYAYALPTLRKDGWSVGEAESEDIDTKVIKTIVERFVNDPKFKWQHSFILIKNNKVLVEEYFYGHTVNTLHDLRSANKSITSILVGIALQQGFISSANDPISIYLPEYGELFAGAPHKAAITIEHMLTMQSGLDANDWDRSSPGNENRVYQSEGDWIHKLFALQMINEPGTTFSYSSIGEIALRQAIVNASGMPLDEFAKKYLFEPLGINNYQWTHKLLNRNDVPYRIQLTSRDFAKLGQLYLNQGIWEGDQIVSSEWVKASTTKHATTTEKRLGFPGYGYFWWKHDFWVKEELFEGFQAQGNGGQFLFVFPKLNSIIVFTSRNFGNSRQINPLQITRDEIIPMLVAMRH
ncbi:CubicO group peptidase, beta-lactamase class C family [Pseudovibrio ascidiaceicola]|uniref:CubicO group peptidase, beta-lactamase class C family n=1 Tax=Pseudovibrio ascidiaceicola TaxID=285279 RepID=A0A1I4G4H5_9HYPH|nr:serine hydrolase [Pseudovibrio ascidiaceicola]SFL24998.1 CubicO group peptidase, beta-lactamase class C family [Pseudovibrio ascidiaceicola]